MHKRSVAILTGFMLACSVSEAGSAAAPAAYPATPCDPGESAKLVSVAGHAYHSAYFSWADMEAGYSSDSIDAFELMTGKPVSTVVFSNHWGSNGKLNIKFPAALVQTIWSNGSIPDLRMMPWTLADWAHRGPDPVISMQKIVNGRFDDALRTWFRKARDLGIPFMAEFGVEVNGEWFPWNGRWNGGGRTDRYGNGHYPDGPERFRDAYRHIVNLSRRVGADDITWSFHVDAHGWPQTWWNRPKYYYPGNSYVDWLAVSDYGEQVPGEEWFPFTDKLGDPSDPHSSYRQIDTLAPDKPFALIEFGVTEDPPNDKAQWIADAYDAVTGPGAQYDFQMVSYWSEQWENGDGSISDLRVDSSSAALAAYRAGVADAYFLDTPQFTCL